MRLYENRELTDATSRSSHTSDAFLRPPVVSVNLHKALRHTSPNLVSAVTEGTSKLGLWRVADFCGLPLAYISFSCRLGLEVLVSSIHHVLYSIWLPR